MGLEVVKEEILRNAEEQAGAIIAEARKEAQILMKEAEKKAQEFKEKADADTRKRMDAIKRQELASAELEGKKMVLDARKQIIEKVFADAKTKLAGMGDKKKESLIKRLLEKTKNDIEIEFVCCNREDAEYFRNFKVESAELLGGFIAENRDRTLRVDNSFEGILEGVREQEIQSINKILFG